MELMEYGGWTLMAIIALSFFGWFLIVHQWIHLRIETRSGIDWIESTIERLPHGCMEEMKTVCLQRGELIGRMVLTALEGFESGCGFTRRHRKVIEAREVKQIRKHLTLISAAGAVLPLLGLLGTVLGMMKTFEALTSEAASGANSLMAGGISEALITTQAGLVASLPIVLMYGVLSSRIRRYMEGCARIMKRLESAIGTDVRHV